MDPQRLDDQLQNLTLKGHLQVMPSDGSQWVLRKDSWNETPCPLLIREVVGGAIAHQGGGGWGLCMCIPLPGGLWPGSPISQDPVWPAEK